MQVGEEGVELGRLVGALERRVGGEQVAQRLPRWRPVKAVAAPGGVDHRLDQAGSRSIVRCEAVRTSSG